METKRLDNAALAAGISPSYINAHGKPQSIAAATKQRLLDAMHRTATAVKATMNPLPAVQVFTHGKKMSLPVAGQGAFHWILTTEEGKQYQGQARGGETLPPRLQPHQRGQAGAAPRVVWLRRHILHADL